MTLSTLAPGTDLSPAPFHLVEEINHRVLNEYAEAIAWVSLAARSSEGPAKSTLKRVADRLQAQADAHRALLPPITDGAMDVAEYITELCASFSKASLAERGVHIAVDTRAVFISADRCWRVGLIVAELLRNALRHGLKSGPGVIGVRLDSGEGLIHCAVCDSGQVAAAVRPGRGQALVRALAADLGGSVDWAFEPRRTVVRFQAPLRAGVLE